MSYYTVIDGKKFDRSLLELAQALVADRSDGRLTQPDAEQILRAAFDRNVITNIEQETLMYITEHFTWTNEATEWRKQTAPILNLEDFESEMLRIKRDFDVAEMQVIADAELITRMNLRFPATISFFAALSKAIQAILIVDRPNTPRYEIGVIINNVIEIFEEDFNTPDKWQRLVTAFLLERLKRGAIRLLPIWEEIPDEERDFSTPENREASENYWIFFVDIETDDHQFWVAVGRTADFPTQLSGLN